MMTVQTPARGHMGLVALALCLAVLVLAATGMAVPSQARADVLAWNVSAKQVDTNASSGMLPASTTTPVAELADTYYFNIHCTDDIQITSAEVRITPSGKAMQTVKSATFDPGVGFVSLGYTFPYEGAYSYYWYVTYQNAAGARTTKTLTASSLYARNGFAHLKNASITLNAKTFYYDGKAHKPSAKVVASNGAELQKGTDYTLSYSSGCKKVGTYQVKVKGKGYFTGTRTFNFKVKVKPTTFKKVVGGKKLKMYLKKVSSKYADGYQVRFKPTSTTTWKTSGKISRKSAKKNGYYLYSKNIIHGVSYDAQVRTYVKISGKVEYSAWSATQSVVTK